MHKESADEQCKKPHEWRGVRTTCASRDRQECEGCSALRLRSDAPLCICAVGSRPLTPVEAVRKNVISQVLLLQKQRAMAHSKAQTESNLLACTTNLEYLSLIYAPAVSWLKYQEIRQ